MIDLTIKATDYVEVNNHKLSKSESLLIAAKMADKSSYGVERVFIEIPANKKYAILLEDEEGNITTLIKGLSIVDADEKGDKYVLMVKARCRPNATGVVEPPPELEEEIIPK